jgi:azurin
MKPRSRVYSLAVLLTLGCFGGAAAFSLASEIPEKVNPSALETDEIREVVITADGNKMAFATTEFSVKAGQEVRLIFDNTATSPAMKHNVVIVLSNDAIKRVGQAALSEQDYVPDDEAIVAYTALADPGETVEVTFTAPETPGDHPFICTFPGHYMSMQGIMKVTE